MKFSQHHSSNFDNDTLKSIQLKDIAHHLIDPKSIVWADLYKLYRYSFIYKAKKDYKCSQKEAECIFQEIMIALYLNSFNDKVQNSEAPLQAYLYKIGKAKLINHTKKEAYQKNKLKELILIQNRCNFHHEIVYLQQHYEVALNYFINQLDKTSQSVIRLFYFQNYCLEAIAIELNYANVNVAKVTRSKAAKKLKNILNKNSIFI